MAYETRVTPAEAFSLSNLRIRSFFKGEVVHSASGDVAWTSALYDSEKAARLQANRMRPRYDAYFSRTGTRFEVEQAEKRADFKRRKREAIDARKAVREKAGDLLAALRELQPEHPVLAGLSFPEIPTE